MRIRLYEAGWIAARIPDDRLTRYSAAERRILLRRLGNPLHRMRSVLRPETAWIYGLSLLMTVMLSEGTSLFDVASPLDSGLAALCYRTAVQIGKPVKLANWVYLVLISEETEPGFVLSGHTTCK